MAEKYGQTPDGIAFPNGELSVMEKQLFNIFISSIGFEEEAKQIKAINRKK